MSVHESMAIDMAEMMRHGLPPLAGGALDQTQIFLEAAQFIWSETAIHRAEHGLTPEGSRG